MSLPLRTHSHTLGANHVSVPCIPLKTWWPYLLVHRSPLVLGGFERGASKLLLQTFWKNLENAMPDHEIFEMHDAAALCQCVPFYLHMDEGVGQRKKGVMVINFQSVFGQECASRYQEHCKSVGHPRRVDEETGMSQSQFHSSKGSTYKSRFLVTCMSKKQYGKKNEDVWVQFLEVLARECCSLMTSGVQVRGTTWFPICLGLKGDAPMLAKAGFFTRYFGTMGKDRGCCHECLAGHDGYDFENCSLQASWINTIGLQPPWKPTKVSPLGRIPTRKYSPEAFYKKDPFHVFKQSLGGYFLASTIVTLGCDLELFTKPGESTAVQNVLDRAHADYAFFMQYEWKGKNNSHLKSFTKEILHFQKLDTYPSARFKGGDCMMLLRWLKHLMTFGVVDMDLKYRTGLSPVSDFAKPLQAKICEQVLKACVNGLAFFHHLHTEGLWLDCSLASAMADQCQNFCLAYCELARITFEQSLTRYRLEPCLHQFMHYSVELRQRPNNLDDSMTSYLPSPSQFLCEADEDFVGKLSRLSRHVHMQTMSQRVIDRYLVKLWLEYQ